MTEQPEPWPVSPTVGGRGPDPSFRVGPDGHRARLSMTHNWGIRGPGTPREAFDIRRKRLREAGTKHEADVATLTLSWDEQTSTNPDDHHTIVTITYGELE